MRCLSVSRHGAMSCADPVGILPSARGDGHPVRSRFSVNTHARTYLRTKDLSPKRLVQCCVLTRGSTYSTRAITKNGPNTEHQQFPLMCVGLMAFIPPQSSRRIRLKIHPKCRCTTALVPDIDPPSARINGPLPAEEAPDGRDELRRLQKDGLAAEKSSSPDPREPQRYIWWR